MTRMQPIALLFAALMMLGASDQPASGSIGEMQAVLAEIEQLAVKAREQKDIIFLNCVNDKLVVVRGLLGIARQSLAEAESKDPDTSAHAKEKIRISLDKVRLLRLEARDCASIPPPETPRTEIEVEKGEGVAQNDPLLDKYRVRYRVSKGDVPRNRAYLGVGLHHVLGGSDRLVRVMLGIDGEKAYDRIDDKAVLPAGSGRMLVEKWVEPGNHTITVRLKISGRRTGGSIRLTATSGINVQIDAGRSALVEIISTMEGTTEPTPLTFQEKPERQPGK